MNANRKLKRPALRYHGGKWRVAPWIIGHFPAHRIYVEPFGGGASLLLRKGRSYGEVYNDMDGDVVNFFQVLRDRSEELRAKLELMPFARAEWVRAYEVTNDPIERALRLAVRSWMGHGSGATAIHNSTGFRCDAKRSGTTPAHDWANWPKEIPGLAERLRGVTIENRAALRVIARHDSKETLFYVDPPYPRSTRNSTARYFAELTDEEHAELAEALKGLQGMVVVSGYDCPLYRELYGDWRQDRLGTHGDGAADRTEVLWFSPNVTRQEVLL